MYYNHRHHQKKIWWLNSLRYFHLFNVNDSLTWIIMNIGNISLREKCLYSEFFWFIFSRIRTEYREIRSISPYSIWMRENTDQKNSGYGHFSRIIFSGSVGWTGFQNCRPPTQPAFTCSKPTIEVPEKYVKSLQS